MDSDLARARSIALFFLATFLYWASMYTYVPILAVHAENLGASMGLVGTIVAAYGFSQFFLRIPLGVWSDRIGLRKPFILAGLATAGLGALGLGLSSDPGWLVVWRGLTGVGAAAWVVFTVQVSTYFTSQRATRAISQVNFVAGFSQMVATYAGGVIAQLWGWRMPFYVAAALGLLGVAVALPLEEKPVAIRRQVSPRELLRLGTRPLLVTVSIVGMLTTWTQFSTVYGFTPVYAARLGADRAELGMLTTVMQLSYTLTVLASAMVTERIGVRTTLMVGIVLQSTGALMVPLLDTVALVAVSQLLGGVGRGFQYPVLMALSIRSVPAQDRATAMGVYQAVYALGMFAGPAMTGVLADAFGLSSVFIFAGMLCVAGGVVVASRVPAN